MWLCQIGKQSPLLWLRRCRAFEDQHEWSRKQDCVGKGLGWGGRAAKLFHEEGRVQPFGIDLTLFSTEFMLKNHTIEL